MMCMAHVPLIVRDPVAAFTRGDIRDDFVSTRRIFHTVLTAAGLAENGEQAYTLAHDAAHDPDRGVVFAEAATPQNVLNLMTKHRPELARERRCDQPRRAVWRQTL